MCLKSNWLVCGKSPMVFQFVTVVTKQNRFASYFETDSHIYVLELAYLNLICKINWSSFHWIYLQHVSWILKTTPTLKWCSQEHIMCRVINKRNLHIMYENFCFIDTIENVIITHWYLCTTRFSNVIKSLVRLGQI